MDVALGVLLGLVLAASAAAAWRLVVAPRRVLSPEADAMRAAVHAATATLPHLRRGLSQASADAAAPHLRTLLQAAAVALCDLDRVLAFDGAGADHHRVGAPAASLAGSFDDARVHVSTRFDCAVCTPPRSSVSAPLVVQGVRVGTLVALFERAGRLRLEDTRAVQQAASLVAAQVELSAVAAQGERLARAELSALRAQISPHFIYNALAAVASFIHSRPEEARELLTEFAEFIRYAFARERSYVTLADELRYVQTYLRLEQARFGERLRVRVQVAPEVLPAVVPVLSLQPLVENAVRHGVEARPGGGVVEISGEDLGGGDVELRVHDDGPGMSAADAERALAGRGEGIGLANVHGRLRQTYGREYGLSIESSPGAGTTVAMTVPKFRAGVRAA